MFAVTGMLIHEGIALGSVEIVHTLSDARLRSSEKIAEPAAGLREHLGENI